MQFQGIHDIKALAFDVQGTCVDFYHPVLRAGATANRDKGLAADWSTLLAEWRELYRAALDAVIAGKRPWLGLWRVRHPGTFQLCPPFSTPFRLS